MLVLEVPGLLSKDGHGDVMCTTHGFLRGNKRGLDGVVIILHGLLCVLNESAMACGLVVRRLGCLELLAVHYRLGVLNEDVVSTAHVVRGALVIVGSWFVLVAGLELVGVGRLGDSLDRIGGVVVAHELGK